MKRLLRYEMFVPKTDDRDERAKELNILPYNRHVEYKSNIGKLLITIAIMGMDQAKERYKWSFSICDRSSAVLTANLYAQANLTTVTLENVVQQEDQPIILPFAELSNLATRLSREMVQDLNNVGFFKSKQLQPLAIADLYPMAEQLQPLVLTALKTIVTEQ